MVVVLGGACSQILRLKPAYYDLIECPSLHIIGNVHSFKVQFYMRSDRSIRSIDLVQLFAQKPCDLNLCDE